MKLLKITEAGLYCPAGHFFIDPWQPVNKAVITHAHADHAREGCRSYLCTRETKALLTARLGWRVAGHCRHLPADSHD